MVLYIEKNVKSSLLEFGHRKGRISCSLKKLNLFVRDRLVHFSLGGSRWVGYVQDHFGRLDNRFQSKKSMNWFGDVHTVHI